MDSDANEISLTHSAAEQFNGIRQWIQMSSKTRCYKHKHIFLISLRTVHGPWLLS